jgi:predicted heme/steroid binding protein
MGELSRYNNGLEGQFPIPATGKVFSLFHSFRTVTGTHTGPYLIGTGSSFPGLKRPGREVDRSPPSSAEVKNGGAISALPRTSSWHGA